jgi:hypothetical protein
MHIGSAKLARAPMLQILCLVVLLLCACPPPQADVESPGPGAEPGLVRIDTELDERLIRYSPADSSDVSNGRLEALLTLHRESCINGSPNAFYSRFNQQTRFLYTKYTQEKLVANFRNSCTEAFLGELEASYKAGDLMLAPDGQTEQGIKRLSLCQSRNMQGSACRRGIEVSSEDGKLKWGWH